MAGSVISKAVPWVLSMREPQGGTLCAGKSERHAGGAPDIPERVGERGADERGVSAHARLLIRVRGHGETKQPRIMGAVDTAEHY